MASVPSDPQARSRPTERWHARRYTPGGMAARVGRVVLLATLVAGVGLAGGLAGAPATPVQAAAGSCMAIASAADLQNINTNLSGSYCLTTNLDLTGVPFTPIGSIATPFTGSFDGKGHTISNLTISLTNASYVGLFGYTSGASITHIGLLNAAITAVNDVGGLVGYQNGGSISQSYSTGGVVYGEAYVGGLVGQQVGGSVSQSHSGDSVAIPSFDPSLSNYYYFGGLVGFLSGGSISQSHSTGTLIDCPAPPSGCDRLYSYDFGGLVGEQQGGSISQSYSTGSFSSGSSSGALYYCGGLVGTLVSGGSISQSYSTVSPGAQGLYAYCGGLLSYGSDGSGSVTSSFWDTTTWYFGSSAGGTGEPDSAMKMQATFTAAGWVFGCSGSWGIAEGAGYPYVLAPIASAADLQAINTNLSDGYCLTTNLDLTGVPFTPIGSIATPFTGSFDGQGHTISNLTISLPTTSFVGLFGYTSGATITHIALLNASITGQLNVGGLVGDLVGGSLSQSSSSGSVSGVYYVGGLVGGAQSGGSITQSFSSASAVGTESVGGLVGFLNGGSIGQSYSTGTVQPFSGGSYVGGLLGFPAGSVTSSFWDVTTSGQWTSGGGTGEPDSAMKMQATFSGAGWDFTPLTGVWSIVETCTYPYLQALGSSSRCGTSLSVAAAGGPYGGTTTLTATLLGAGNTPLSGQPISFTLNGTSVGQASTGADGVATLSGVSLAGLSAGSYVTGVGAAFAGAGVYQASSGTNSLRVAPAPLTVTVNSASKTYGAANPAFSGTISGVQNGDTITATYGTTATQSSPAGAYAITATLNDPGHKLGNYSVSVTPSTLTVSQAPLTITASSASMTISGTVPPVTPSYSGLVNGDTAPTTPPTCGTTATSGSPVGTYPTSCGGAADANYQISYRSGTLTIRYGVKLLYKAPASATIGSSVPITIAVVNAAGLNLSSASLGVNALCVVVVKTGTKNCTPHVISYGQGRPFSYKAGLSGGGGYQFSVATTGLATGVTYQLLFRVAGEDGNSYHVQPKASFILTP